MFIYILEQNDKIKIGKTINPKQRLTKLEKEWGTFSNSSIFFKFSINKLKQNNLTIDNIEKTIHRLLKLKGIYINDLDKKDGYKEFFKKVNNIDVFQLFYDNFKNYIEEEYSLIDINNFDKENINFINKEYISIHNNILSGRHNWNANEIKIIFKLITQISKDKKKYELSFSELSNLLGDVNNNFSSKYLKEVSENLINKKFEISKTENNYVNLNWFKDIKYDKGIMSFVINEDIYPYLINLKENLTKFNVNFIFKMKSNYSMRIYQLLKQYEKKSYKIINIDFLRFIFKIPNTYQFNHIKKQVLNKAKEELEKYSDIVFDFEEIKKGRKVIEIKFIVNKKTNEILNKYYGQNIISHGIKYTNIINIQDNYQNLNIIFKNGDSIKVKNENFLSKLIIK